MKRFAIAPLFAILATTADAEGNWIIGAFANGETGIYTGEKDNAELLPYFAYETERLHIGLDGISYEVLNLGSTSIDITLDPRFAPDFPNTTLFEGLDRDDAVELGFASTFSFGEAYLSVDLAGDVADAHGGFGGSVAIGYETAIGAIAIDASAGLRLRDAKLNNYLYGVSAAETTATRPLFEMEDTATGFASISAAFEVTDGLYLIGELTYEDLGEATDSPLVDATDQTSLIIGVGYQF